MKKWLLMLPLALTLGLASCAHCNKCCAKKCDKESKCKEGKCPLKEGKEKKDAEDASSEAEN